MTTITGTVTDVTKRPDKTVWEFSSVLRESHDGETVITTKTRSVCPDSTGLLTVELDPGYAVVTYDRKKYQVTVPETGPVDIWDLLAAAVAIPPGTSEDMIAAAVDAYFVANPLDEDIAAAVDAYFVANPVQAAGGGSVNGTWRMNYTSGATPTNGYVTNNGTNGVLANATWIRFSDFTKNGVDFSGVMMKLVSGDRIIGQATDNAAAYAILELTGAPIDGGSYVQFPIVFIDGNTEPSGQGKTDIIAVFKVW
jgi:hypothetical protein